MTTAALLGIAFLVLGVSAALLMLHLWGYPFDEKTQTSSAPKFWEFVHRLLGYAYTVVYIVLMVRMVPRLWQWPEELPTRSAIHAVLGVAIGAVLLTKILIIRFFPYFKRYLHVFGIALLVLTVATLGLPLAMAFREWHLSRSLESAGRRLETMARLGSVPTLAGESARLASEEVLSAGREQFLTHCWQCHDSRRTLSETRTADEWLRITTRMAAKSATPEYRTIAPAQVHAIAAYLTHIRGKDSAPSEPQAEGTAGVWMESTTPESGTTPEDRGPKAIATATGVPTFDVSAVESLFLTNCVDCHSSARARAGIVLETARSAVESGAVTAGDVRGSRLLRAVRGEFQPRMPLNGPYLSPEQIALLERWVASMTNDGAAAVPEDGGVAKSPVAGASPEANTSIPPTPVRTVRSTPGPGETVRFDHVQPILNASCVHCHSRPGTMGAPPEGLVLSSHAELFRTPERPVVVPGIPAASLLLRHIRGTETPRMPFDGPPFLTEEEVALLERWIRDGARDANGAPGPMPVGAELRMRGVLEGRWVVDGVPFRVSGATELRDIRVGGVVELRARVAADGSLDAERVRGR